MPPIVKSGMYHKGDGRYGYKASRQFISGVVEYSSPVREEMGTHIVYSAKALRYLRDMGLSDADILRFHAEREHKITRIDIAVDVTDSGMDIAKLFREYEENKVKTRVRSKATGIIKTNGEMETMYVGSKKKRTKLIRIYNKAIEQGIDGDWIRIEYETRAQNATRAVMYIAKNGYSEASMKELIVGFCDFTDDEVWSSLFDCEPMSIPTMIESDGNTVDWLMNSVAPSLAKEIIKDSRIEQAFYDRVVGEIRAYFSNMD